MILRLGDKGEDVKVLQRGLDRIGSLLIVDGDFGPATQAAVGDARVFLGIPGPAEADESLQQAVAALEEPSPELTTPGVTFIGREEVASPAAYRHRYRRPTWPSEQSGITIGIGYDLRFVDAAKLRSDWGDQLSADALTRLSTVVGVVGSPGRLASVADVEVPLPSAIAVFLRHMLPEHIGLTRGAYPQLDDLPPPRRTALVSLVFNRGASLTGDRRREMLRIRELLDKNDLEPIAAEFESMTRLWSPDVAPGLIARRRREATLWRAGFEPLQLA